MAGSIPENLTIGISPISLTGVAIAAYSSRRSRMWVWDARTLDVLGFQDLAARAHLLDISADGNFCAYYAEAHAKGEHYIAISHPPFFTALWIVDVFHLHACTVTFGDDKVVRYYCGDRDPTDWHKHIPQKPLEDSPFQFERIVGVEEHPILASHAWKRCSGAFDGTSDFWRDSTIKHEGKWRDCMGRSITVTGHEVLADGSAFLDCRREAFCQVQTPDWARGW